MKKFITIVLGISLAFTAFANNARFDIVGRYGIASKYDASESSTDSRLYGGVEFTLIESLDGLDVKFAAGTNIYYKDLQWVNSTTGWTQSKDVEKHGSSFDTTISIGVPLPVGFTSVFYPSVGVICNWQVEPSYSYAVGITAAGRLATSLNTTTKFFVGYQGSLYFYDSSITKTNTFSSDNAITFGFTNIVR